MIVAATAGTSDITVNGATLATYTSTILAGADGSGASQTGHTMRLTNKAPGRAAEAQFDIILSDVVPIGTITWDVITDVAAETQVEIYSLNDPAAPRVVDRSVAHGTTARFTTLSALLASRGRLNVSPITLHLVLAQYYPWYELETWRDPQMVDRPLEPYSSDDQRPSAVRRSRRARRESMHSSSPGRARRLIGTTRS